MDFKNEIIKELKKYAKIVNLEVPPNKDFGDYAFPCFSLAKKLKKNPNEIAKDLAKKLKKFKTKVIGPYLNFFVDKTKLAKNVIKQILKEKDKYGSKKENKKIVVEYPSPNTNKPLHLGHVRNILIGQCISNVFEFLGNKVFRINLNNDRGIHICKSMLAYQKWGRNSKPKVKPDHFVGKYYVMFNKKKNKNLEEEAQELLKKWEKGDKKIISLWKKMNNWALKGFKETYKRLNVKFKKVYNESSVYGKGKKIILDGYKKKIFSKDKEGAIFIDLDKKLGKKILLRSDGTSLYITQDIYLAEKKYKDFKFDKSIYVVGSEQNYHFKVLFKVLKLLKNKWADNCHHLSYGMIYLPEGRMKSREGTIVDADDIIDKMNDLAKKELKKRYKLSKKELEKRAKQIGLGALRFFILKMDIWKDMLFNPKESINFEGDTGPYCQYAYARACSILRKVKAVGKVDYGFLGKDPEINLVKKLNEFSDIVEKASKDLKPNLLATYVHDLARTFNEFYHDCPVNRAPKNIKRARLDLVKATIYVLKTGLNLLNIDAPEKM